MYLQNYLISQNINYKKPRKKVGFNINLQSNTLITDGDNYNAHHQDYTSIHIVGYWLHGVKKASIASLCKVLFSKEAAFF